MSLQTILIKGNRKMHLVKAVSGSSLVAPSYCVGISSLQFLTTSSISHFRSNQIMLIISFPLKKIIIISCRNFDYPLTDGSRQLSPPPPKKKKINNNNNNNPTHVKILVSVQNLISENIFKSHRTHRTISILL